MASGRRRKRRPSDSAHRSRHVGLRRKLLHPPTLAKVLHFGRHNISQQVASRVSVTILNSSNHPTHHNGEWQQHPSTATAGSHSCRPPRPSASNHSPPKLGIDALRVVGRQHAQLCAALWEQGRCGALGLFEDPT